MGTFTVATGLGMLAFGLSVTMIIGVIGLIVIRSQAQTKQKVEARSDIEKQIDRMKEVRQG